MRGLRLKSNGMLAADMSFTAHLSLAAASSLKRCALVEDSSTPPGASNRMHCSSKVV